MKKYILTVSMIGLMPFTAFANQEFFTSSPENAKTGIVIVPLSQMPNPESVSEYLKEQKTKGYSFKESNDVRQMIASNKRMYSSELSNDFNPKDTHMKASLSKVKLAFKYKDLPFLNPVGYAPGGAYIPDAGWTMVGTFFNDKEVGACEYRLNDMRLSKGAVMIPKESVRHDVNNKITTVYVDGSKKSGFMYNVNWSDDTYNHFLICANMKLDHNITDHMIQLAKRIDSNIT